jgi:hypothetical protein
VLAAHYRFTDEKLHFIPSPVKVSFLTVAQREYNDAVKKFPAPATTTSRIGAAGSSVIEATASDIISL